MRRTIANVIPSRTVDATKLGWLSGKRATTRQNFPANFQYVDLRGFSLADLDDALGEESDSYEMLEAAEYGQEVIDEVDRLRAQSRLAPMVDFGVAAAVIALSTLGCVPVTSCRGPTLGMRAHAQPAPMIVFYARKVHLPALLQAVAQADCQIVNNTAKLEVYADELIKMRRLAVSLREQIASESRRA